MTDLRLPAAALLAATALVFLAGVRLAFRRPGRGHRYRASLVSAGVFLAQVVAIARAPVPPARLAAEGVLVALSVALFAWTVRTNRVKPLALAFSGAAPEHVQTRGPYGLVRHPFYASYLLAFAAGAAAAPSPLAGLAALAAAATYLRAARGEEAGFAASPLAAEYAAYAARVGMFLPRLAPARRAPARAG